MGRPQHGVGDADGPGAVGEGREPVDLGAVARVDGPQGVGDEGVEAVLVALWVAGRDDGVGRRGRVELVRVALDDLRRAAPPHPEGVGVLLVEGQRGAVGHDLEPQLVLVAGRDLAHHHRTAHPGDGAEQDQGHVLGGDLPPRPGAPAAGRGREGGDVGTRVLALGHRRHELRAHRGETVAGHELDEVAPVRADVGEGSGGAGQLGIDAPVVVLVGRQPVLQVAAVGEAHGEGTVGDSGPRLADHRVEAVDERHRGDRARPVGGSHQRGRRRRVGGQRLLAHHVLPGLEGGQGQRTMQVVGGADVDDVDVGGGRQLLGSEPPLRAQPRHGLLGGVG